MGNSRLLIALFAITGACSAQTPVGKGVAGVAEDLRACVQGLATGLSSDSQFASAMGVLRANADLLAQSLAAATKAPPEYLANLEAVLDICRPLLMTFTPGSPFAPAANRSNLAAFSRDIGAKATDARNTGSARLVPVEVLARNGTRSEDGWTITYLWLPGPANQGKPFPALTPAAKVSLPPGFYSFRAEKTVAGKKASIDGGSGPIGGTPTAVIAISVR